jgi:hypothetical protein
MEKIGCAKICCVWRENTRISLRGKSVSKAIILYHNFYFVLSKLLFNGTFREKLDEIQDGGQWFIFNGQYF